MSVSRAVAEVLRAEGVAHVFGVAGSHALGLREALAGGSIRFVEAAHEHTAACMAGTYGYLTGRPGVSLLPAGPAATSALTGVAQAMASSLPMVLVTADAPARVKREASHGVDRPGFLHRVLADVTKQSVRVEEPAALPEVLARAFWLARSGRPGPVHVDMALDPASGTLAGELRHVPRPSAVASPSEGFAEEIAARLRAARRPLVCAGRGVLVHHANDELRRLAERVGAPVLCTAHGLGAFDEAHPLALGTIGERSADARALASILAGCDFLLVVGLRVDTTLTGQLAAVAPAANAFIALEEPEAEVLRAWPGPIEAVDVRAALRAVLARLGERTQEPGAGRLAAIAEHRRASQRERATALDEAPEGPSACFGAAVRALVARLERDAIVVSGAAGHHAWVRGLVPVRERTSLVGDAAWGTTGAELGSGIAAKLVHPGRQVVAITSGASLLRCTGDLATAVRERAHVLVMVLDEGRCETEQQRTLAPIPAEHMPAVAFATTAEAMGGVGLRVEAPASLPAAIDAALVATARRPVLLHVVGAPRMP